MTHSSITFILALKGKAEYSESWIKNNARPGYKFHVADGSIDNTNREIFEKYKHDNLFYKFYGTDDTVKIFLNKVRMAISACDTEYVMFCDNDDLINYKGIQECLKALDEHSDFTCAGGSIFSVFENKKKNQRYNFPIPFFDTAAIHNIDAPFEGFKEIRKEYKYLWYAIYRKKDLLRIWDKMIEIDIQDLFLLEILHVDLTLAFGKYYHIGGNHYIRLMNPSTSGAQSYGAYYHKRIFFDDSYRDQLCKLNKFYTELFKHDLKEIQSEQENFYIWYFKTAPRIKNALFRKIHGVIIRLRLFKIQTVINGLNLYLKCKKIFINPVALDKQEII